MIYLSSQLAEVHPIVFNSPFEDFEESASPHGPCRTIVVTAAVRRLDQAAKDAHLPAEWLAFRATLSERNLRMATQPRVAPGRVQENTHRVLPSGKAVRLSGRFCPCGKQLVRTAKGTLCAPCLILERKANRTTKPRTVGVRLPCGSCPRLLRVGKTGVCYVCKKNIRRRAA